MCDYSLHNVMSRPAQAGDELVSSGFRSSGSGTRGFIAVGEPERAVCLLPGTELVFETEPWFERLFSFRGRKAASKVARFRQINLENPHTHHDALEFFDGQILLINKLRLDQHARVLQLPAQSSLDAQLREDAITQMPQIVRRMRERNGIA